MRFSVLSTVAAIALIVAFTQSSSTAGLALTGTRQVQHTITDVSPRDIDVVDSNTLIAAFDRFVHFNGDPFEFDETIDIKSIALNNGPVSPAIGTQSVFGPGESTFGGSFVATDGAVAIHGQTTNFAGSFAPGKIFLTNINTGATNEMDVAGNTDATSEGGSLYLSAAATTTTGLADNGFSGIFLVENTGASPTGLNLIIDTGAPSGQVSGIGGGDLIFALGGNSIALQGGFNDLYLLQSEDIDTALAAGQTNGITPAAADRLIDGPTLRAAIIDFANTHRPSGSEPASDFLGISDIESDNAGNLFVSLTNFYSNSNFELLGSVGALLQLTIYDTPDATAQITQILALRDDGGIGDLAYNPADDVLWVVAGDDLIGLSNVPEPGMAALLLLVAPVAVTRRTSRP